MTLCRWGAGAALGAVRGARSWSVGAPGCPLLPPCALSVTLSSSPPSSGGVARAPELGPGTSCGAARVSCLGDSPGPLGDPCASGPTWRRVHITEVVREAPAGEARSLGGHEGGEAERLGCAGEAAMTPACSAGREVGIWKGFCLDAGPPSLPAAGRAAGPCPFPPEQRVQGPSLGGGAAGPPAHPPAAGHFQNRERGQGCSHQGPCLEGFLSPQAATACAGSGQAQPPPAAQPPPVAVAVPAAAEATLPARLRAEQIPLLEPLLWPAAPRLGVLQAVEPPGLLAPGGRAVRL